MSLTSLLLVVFCGALTVLAALDVVRQRRAVERLRALVIRQHAYRAERERYRTIREQFAGGTDRTGDLITLPTEATRLGHETIAAIPFTVLENIPATAETSKLVRAIHDEISGTVYDIISGTTRGISGAIKRGFTGSPARSSTDGAEIRADADAVRDAVDDAAARADDDGADDGNDRRRT